jgi:hypothetical protein
LIILGILQRLCVYVVVVDASLAALRKFQDTIASAAISCCTKAVLAAITLFVQVGSVVVNNAQ